MIFFSKFSLSPNARKFTIIMDKFVRKRPKADSEVKETELIKQDTPKIPAPLAVEESKNGFLSYENFEDQLSDSWRSVLRQFLDNGKLRKIHTFVSNEYSTNVCRPPTNEIFTAFKLTDFENIKVVIVGQDPYPGPIEAMGLSFSVHREVKVPGSLRNIYKCLQTDPNVNFRIPKHGDLTRWAQQGVFMLNAVLTVRQGAANSHAKKGWEDFTDEVIKAINKEKSGVVFMLWGAFAQAKAAGVDRSKHLILEACHPSPLSAIKGGFYQCGHFSRTNQYLSSRNQPEIDWNLD